MVARGKKKREVYVSMNAREVYSLLVPAAQLHQTNLGRLEDISIEPNWRPADSSKIRARVLCRVLPLLRAPARVLMDCC